ncbi:hypothetical protein OUZ56_033322 [Daphnia magna]|uniref:Uncharacterized protein n=1 Tax=Daphnia magna TaxID=35525 RepID=A0ABQ9ZXL9_9CRUS|nr:hypothetical protein OUZ56_033322 [Daphnia magna]
MTHLRQERRQKSVNMIDIFYNGREVPQCFNISEKEERKRSERRIGGGIEEEFGTKGLLRTFTRSLKLDR